MRVSEQWLRTFVSPELDAVALAHMLTMGGLEVESMSILQARFSNVVVGRVLSARPHPNADRLQVCEVDDGSGEILTIVCGAPNVAAGMNSACARVGATLPRMDIAKAKVRGVESHGMLCSARELGVSDEADGIMVLDAALSPGAALDELLGLPDTVLTLKLTPNRADCQGMLGVARELSALSGADLSVPDIPTVAVAISDRLPIRIEADDLCGRFTGRIVRGVNAGAKTPQWMRNRLERAGQRSISALVDISNYVMLELNRPNHIFDLDHVASGLTVRWGRAAETLTLLNGQTVSLDERVGVIATAEDAPVSLAGIMGGNTCAVTDSTHAVYIEAAFWWPSAIRGRARRYGLASEAAHRFERGVDYADTVCGVERITQLILDICGGEAGPLDDQVRALPERVPVSVRADRVRRVLGVDLGVAAIRDVFRRLQFDCSDVAGQQGVLQVTPPSYRFDITLEADLIEEIGRVWGYDNIDECLPSLPQAMLPAPEASRSTGELRRLIAARDYQEVVNYAFVALEWEQKLLQNQDPIVLENPIASDMSAMRSSLLPGLVATIAANRRRSQHRVRVFEIGRVFLRDVNGQPVAGFSQPERLAGAAYGEREPEQWGVEAVGVDFFDVKADLEVMYAPRTVACEPLAHPFLHPGRAARVRVAGEDVGVIGELHPYWVQFFDLGRATIVFELDLASLRARDLPHYREVSMFQAVRRDLALIVGDEVPAEHVRKALQNAAPHYVKEVELFDLYRGPGLSENEKSLAFRIVMQDNQRTLEDGDADQAIAALVDAVRGQFGARLR